MNDLLVVTTYSILCDSKMSVVNSESTYSVHAVVRLENEYLV